jgi:small subunit ribosomal protein S9
MAKLINSQGKRKRAVARAALKAGKGIVTINDVNLEDYQPQLYALRIKEPLILAGDVAKKVDIKVNVNGGGVAGQADAIRLAIAKALSEYKSGLKEVFLDYDRQLLVADVRRKEPSKPGRQGKARSKRQKSYR